MNTKKLDRSEPTPENQLWHARQLPNDDLKRHASVCLDNACPGNHADTPGSFTCACVIVAQERGLLREDGVRHLQKTADWGDAGDDSE